VLVSTFKLVGFHHCHIQKIRQRVKTCRLRLLAELTGDVAYVFGHRMLIRFHASCLLLLVLSILFFSNVG
jgi:hypothetical protein